MTNVNLLKSTMAKVGDLSFVACIMKILNISRSTASKKLNGKAEFNQSEISKLAEHYKMTAAEVKEIFITGE